jgi:hypothetical protein
VSSAPRARPSKETPASTMRTRSRRLVSLPAPAHRPASTAPVSPSPARLARFWSLDAVFQLFAQPVRFFRATPVLTKTIPSRLPALLPATVSRPVSMGSVSPSPALRVRFWSPECASASSAPTARFWSAAPALMTRTQSRLPATLPALPHQPVSMALVSPSPARLARFWSLAAAHRSSARTVRSWLETPASTTRTPILLPATRPVLPHRPVLTASAFLSPAPLARSW